MSTPTPRSVCVCGRGFASAFGMRVHQRTCEIERARSDAFVKAVTERRPDDAHRDGERAVRDALAGRMEAAPPAKAAPGSAGTPIGRTASTVIGPVPSTGDRLWFTFRAGGVVVTIDSTEVEMSWHDWEHIAKVYGRRRQS